MQQKESMNKRLAIFMQAPWIHQPLNKKVFRLCRQSLQRIAAIQNANDILHQATTEYNTNLSPMFSFYANQDDKNSNAIVAHFDQGGLGLPNKDFYTSKDAAMANIRDAYVKYITKILALAGDDSAAAKQEAPEVMQIEYQLANASKTPVELRDPEAQQVF